jgi:hypothetical protein
VRSEEIPKRFYNDKYYLPQRNSRVFHRGRRENFVVLCGYFLWLFSVVKEMSSSKISFP